MPVRDGLPAAERRRHIPPRDTTTGPPEHPVEHHTVIDPPPTTTRDLVGQQRFQTSPFRIGQIVSMQHPPGLPHPALKIRGTRSRLRPVTRDDASAAVCVDVGSTWTKAVLVRSDGALAGFAEHPTTAADVLAGGDAAVRARVAAGSGGAGPG